MLFFSVKLLVVYFFLDALFGLLLFFFDCGFHFSFFAVICLFFLMFLFAFFKKCSSSVFLWLFFIIFSAVFCGEGIFHGDFFCCFFFHSLWRFDDFYCLYLIWHSMGSAQCVIYVRHQISEDNAQSSGLS